MKMIGLFGICILILASCSIPKDPNEKILTLEELNCYGATYCYNKNGACISWINKFGFEKWSCYQRCPEISKEALLMKSIEECSK